MYIVSLHFIKWLKYRVRYTNSCFSVYINLYVWLLKPKLRGLSPHANYTDRAAAAGRRS